MPGEYDILRSMLSDRIVAFHPMMARVLGGVNEALLFQQLSYWSDKGSNPDWIYKTQKDIEEELTLTRTQQENARRKLRSLGVIEETKRGVPAKLYYRVIWQRAFELLEEYTAQHTTESPVAAQDAGNLQPRMQEPVKDAGNPHPRMRQTRTPVRSKPARKDGVRTQSITESTQRETTERSFEISKGPSKNSLKNHEDRAVIEDYITDYSREMRDDAKLSSSVSRAFNIYQRSGMDLDAFLGALILARSTTQKNSAAIKKMAPGTEGHKAKMPYFFGVLEDLLGVTKDALQQAGD